MLKLVNITKNDNVIEADYIPESSDLKAHASYNMETGEESYEVLDEYDGTYGRMAINGIKMTIEEFEESGKLRKERVVMWY